LSEKRSGRYSVLQKIQVECKTCGISDAFYSNLSVEQFKVRHAGHEIVEPTGRGKAGHQVAEPTGLAKPSPARFEQAASEEKSLEEEVPTKVGKVIVNMEASLSLGQPLIRVRGFDQDLQEAFSTSLPFDEAKKARQMLAKGEFVDYDVTGRRYVWDAEVVEYELDAQEMLATQAQETPEAQAAEPVVETSQAPQDASEVALASPQPSVAAQEQGPEPPIGEEISAPIPEPAQEPHREPAPAAAPPAPAPVQVTPKEAAVPKQQQKDDNPLLVSKSWYIQGGTGNREEAVRVSKVLREFRWRVEPVYTIGVILDDMLSIETSRNQISRTLVSRVEGTGYRLTAVTIEQGKPVAWFRRHEAGSQGADESELDLEPDVSA
jgi:hypothetical protein